MNRTCTKRENAKLQTTDIMGLSVIRTKFNVSFFIYIFYWFLEFLGSCSVLPLVLLF